MVKYSAYLNRRVFVMLVANSVYPDKTARNEQTDMYVCQLDPDLCNGLITKTSLFKYSRLAFQGTH